MQAKENIVHLWQEMGADSWLERIKVKRTHLRNYRKAKTEKRDFIRQQHEANIPHALQLGLRALEAAEMLLYIHTILSSL